MCCKTSFLSHFLFKQRDLVARQGSCQAGFRSPGSVRGASVSPASAPSQHIKKQRHHFANKGPYSQSYGFSSNHVCMWENWTVKKAECWRIDAFELWCWRRLLRIPWAARRLNQSSLKEISPKYSLEGLTLKLKLPIVWPLYVKNWIIWKDTDAGKDWRREEKSITEDEMLGWHHRLNGHEFE